MVKVTVNKVLGSGYSYGYGYDCGEGNAWVRVVVRVGDLG